MDPKHIEVTLIPFLERSAIGFTEKLWSLLLSAQKDPLGIPQEFVEQRMEELKKQKNSANFSEKAAKMRQSYRSGIRKLYDSADPVTGREKEKQKEKKSRGEKQKEG